MRPARRDPHPKKYRHMHPLLLYGPPVGGNGTRPRTRTMLAALCRHQAQTRTLQTRPCMPNSRSEAHGNLSGPAQLPAELKHSAFTVDTMWDINLAQTSRMFVALNSPVVMRGTTEEQAQESIRTSAIQHYLHLNASYLPEQTYVVTVDISKANERRPSLAG